MPLFFCRESDVKKRSSKTKRHQGKGLLRLHRDIDKPVTLYVRYEKPAPGCMTVLDEDGWFAKQLKNIKEL